MKRSELAGFEQGSAEYVVVHSVRQHQRGKAPSMAFRHELNPRKALALAEDEMVNSWPFVRMRDQEAPDENFDPLKEGTNGRLRLRDSSFYTGRGVNEGDFNAEMLEGIYRSLLSHNGPEAATNFVNFVNNLWDMSASAFIQAFDRFWEGGCKNFLILQPDGSGHELTGRTQEALQSECFVLWGQALDGRKSSKDEVVAKSRALKQPFINAHKGELLA